MSIEEKDTSALPRWMRSGAAMTTRRGFFTSALALAGAATLAGCGGGGGSDRRYDGTYRSSGGGGEATVSVSIDRDGLLTFFVLFSDDSVADYGQSFVDNSGYFVQNFAGYRTYGRVRSGRIDGRTELSNDSSDGFNWTADLYFPSSFGAPSSRLVGSFDGFTRLNGVAFTTFLTVAPDGTSTIFSEIDRENTVGIEELLFDGVSFDRNGSVPSGEYFLSLFDDQFTLRASGNSDVILRVIFGADVPSVNIEAGDTVDLVLSRQTRSAVQTRAAAGGERNVNPAALERIFKVLREKQAAK